MPRNLFYKDGSKVQFSKSSERELDNLIIDFNQFLVDKENSYILLEGVSLSDGSYKSKKLPLVYCCDQSYKNIQMAKLYRLNDWYNSQIPSKRVITMLTLTTFQKEFDNYYDQYDFLRESWLKLKDNMKIDLGNFNYLVVAEPHKSGFVHYHILVFASIKQSDANNYVKLWSEKYNAGSARHGIDIKADMEGALRSIKNYLMKYLAKTFTLTYDEPEKDLMDFDDALSELVPVSNERQEAYSKINNLAVQSAKDYYLRIFHAVKWKMNRRNTDYKGFRAFQPSRDLSRIMALPPKEKSLTTVWTSMYFVFWGERYPMRLLDSDLRNVQWVKPPPEDIINPPPMPVQIKVNWSAVDLTVKSGVSMFGDLPEIEDQKIIHHKKPDNLAEWL